MDKPFSLSIPLSLSLSLSFSQANNNDIFTRFIILYFSHPYLEITTRNDGVDKKQKKNKNRYNLVNSFKPVMNEKDH